MEIPIVTGCYGDIDGIGDNYLVVSISGGDLKKWFEIYGIGSDILGRIDYQEIELAPSKEIYSEYEKSKDILLYREIQYRTRFLKEIIGDDEEFLGVFNRLENIAKNNNKDKILVCCYEEAKYFCHRHIVAEKLIKLRDVDILEFSIEGEVRRLWGKIF